MNKPLVMWTGVVLVIASSAMLLLKQTVDYMLLAGFGYALLVDMLGNMANMDAGKVLKGITWILFGLGCAGVVLKILDITGQFSL